MPKKNAFFYFMIDFKQREEAKGVRFANLGDVSPLAGAVWETMSASERQPYLQRAKAYNPSSSPKGKTEPDEQDKVEMRKQVIAERVKYAQARNVLDVEEFYLIALTYFGRTLDGAYLPAELAVVKYSLRHGVMDRMHFYVNPGEIPLGAAYSVFTHTENTHKLPLPPNAMGLQNCVEIAIKFFRFFSLQEKMPVLYTSEETLPMVESMLPKMLEIHTKHSELFVCPLSELFYRLLEATGPYSKDNSPAPSAKSAQYLLQMDSFAYAEGISCDYHEKDLNMCHCALSQATRWTYIISKYCCPEMGIECIPGKHIPRPIEKSLDELTTAEGDVKPCISGIASLSMKFESSRNAASEKSSSVQKPDSLLKSAKKSSDETTTRAIDLLVKQENPNEKRAVVATATQKPDIKSPDETIGNGTDLLLKQDNSDEKRAVVETATQKPDIKSPDETIENGTDLLVKQDNPDETRPVLKPSSWLRKRIELRKSLKSKSVAKDALSNQPHTADVTLSADNNLATSGSDKQEMVDQDHDNTFPTSMEPSRLREYSSYRRGCMSRRGHTQRPKYN